MAITIEKARKEIGSKMEDLVTKIGVAGRNWEEAESNTERDCKKESSMLIGAYNARRTDCEILEMPVGEYDTKVSMAIGSLNRSGITKPGDYQFPK